MNYLQHSILLMVAAISAISSGCSTSPVAPNKVEGYPVYKFLNFGDYKQRKELRVIDSKGREISVYIRHSDYRSLWAINPHDLNRMRKSHFVKIEYRAHDADGRRYYWATSFESELVDREPHIRK